MNQVVTVILPGNTYERRFETKQEASVFERFCRSTHGNGVEVFISERPALKQSKKEVKTKEG